MNLIGDDEGGLPKKRMKRIGDDNLPAQIPGIMASRRMDARKAKRDGLRRQLPSNIFIQFLAGPSDLRESGFGWLLRTIAWITLAIAPVLLLLMMQIQFLPYHSHFVVWTQRVALGLDLALVWWLWRKILSGRAIDGGRRPGSRLWPWLGVALSGTVLLFSVTVATFPGEWQEDRLPSRLVLPLHDGLFNAEPDGVTRRRLPFSSTLVLPGLNVYEGLGIDDPDKVKWHDFVFRARGRDLRGAIFDDASLPKVDFAGADLQGASLAYAQLQGASLEGAQLQGASLYRAQLQGASLDGARLQGASLDQAQLQGASLEGAQLQGESLVLAQLQGASLNGAQLQGASLGNAQLQGASLDKAQLQGASLDHAQLQGASLVVPTLEATDLTGAYLWRTTLWGVTPSALRMSGETFLPEWIEPVAWDAERKHVKPQRWDKKAYQALRIPIESLPPTTSRRAEALKRIEVLDCANSDPTLASCDPPWAWIPPLQPPPEAEAGRKMLEAARVDDGAYAAALAKTLKDLVCSGSENNVYIVRGYGFRHRLQAAGAAASGLIDDLVNKDSKDCPVSAALTDADKAKLLRLKNEAKAEPAAMAK